MQLRKALCSAANVVDWSRKHHESCDRKLDGVHHRVIAALAAYVVKHWDSCNGRLQASSWDDGKFAATEVSHDEGAGSDGQVHLVHCTCKLVRKRCGAYLSKHAWLMVRNTHGEYLKILG